MYGGLFHRIIEILERKEKMNVLGRKVENLNTKGKGVTHHEASRSSSLVFLLQNAFSLAAALL